ncbi:MAG: carbohydrate ABC transporter permease [Clostridiales bacterium]|nr:carbohydrate ABC transporter permease [Clostridiales bacterium]
MTVVYIICILAGVLTIVPFLYVVAGSLATEKELVERAFFIIPHTISTNAYKYIISDGSIFRGLANSFFIMIAGTVINMAFTTTLAYPLSKAGLRGRNAILNLIIVTMLFSGGMIPNYLVVKSLGMLDSYWALMLPGAVNAFNLIIVKNFFQELPHELEEAAKIDGCSDVGIFAKIILPLSKPALASVSLFYAVSHWNDFFNSLIYLNSTKKFPVQIILRQIVLLAQGASADGSSIDFGAGGTPPEQAVKMAATVVATIPILCVYPFVQKYFEQGVMVGAVKG